MKKILKLSSLLFSILLTEAGVAHTADTSFPLRKFQTKKAPKPVGPYAQGISVDLKKGTLFFVAGQIPLNPKTGKEVEGNIRIKTRQTLDNIEAILKSAGSDWKYVIRMDVFLKDLNDFSAMNEEYVKRFPNGISPVRQTVQVGRMPMESQIEISSIALIPNGR